MCLGLEDLLSFKYTDKYVDQKKKASLFFKQHQHMIRIMMTEQVYGLSKGAAGGKGSLKVDNLLKLSQKSVG